VAVVCFAMIGYVATRQGMMPIRRITITANEITSSKLHKRLALDDAPAELREFAMAFNGMLDRLDDSFSRLSQFSSDLAHELRTPINNLMGEAQVALSKVRTSTEYRGVVESSVEELERLSRMIASMLFLAHADHAETVIAPVSLEVHAELEKIAEFYQIAADESGTRINCTGEANLFADPILFRRAIGNLLSNALRHSIEGSEILMEAAREPGGFVNVSVRNSGPGIPAKHLTRIFDRFYRTEPSREKASEGAGLGLAIVKTIMQLHGGSVTVDSTPNAYTCFTLSFPPRQSATTV
jgi:two-component system, OmpR family, heavy metal sensor histidine kinase CusS